MTTIAETEIFLSLRKTTASPNKSPIASDLPPTIKLIAQYAAEQAATTNLARGLFLLHINEPIADGIKNVPRYLTIAGVGINLAFALNAIVGTADRQNRTIKTFLIASSSTRNTDGPGFSAVCQGRFFLTAAIIARQNNSSPISVY